MHICICKLHTVCGLSVSVRILLCSIYSGYSRTSLLSTSLYLDFVSYFRDFSDLEVIYILQYYTGTHSGVLDIEVPSFLWFVIKRVPLYLQTVLHSLNYLRPFVCNPTCVDPVGVQLISNVHSHTHARTQAHTHAHKHTHTHSTAHLCSFVHFRYMHMQVCASPEGVTTACFGSGVSANSAVETVSPSSRGL